MRANGESRDFRALMTCTDAIQTLTSFVIIEIGSSAVECRSQSRIVGTSRCTSEMKIHNLAELIY